MSSVCFMTSRLKKSFIKLFFLQNAVELKERSFFKFHFYLSTRISTSNSHEIKLRAGGSASSIRSFGCCIDAVRQSIVPFRPAGCPRKLKGKRLEHVEKRQRNQRAVISDNAGCSDLLRDAHAFQNGNRCERLNRSFACELPDSHLQVINRLSDQEQNDDVRNQEGASTCRLNVNKIRSQIFS